MNNIVIFTTRFHAMLSIQIPESVFSEKMKVNSQKSNGVFNEYTWDDVEVPESEDGEIIDESDDLIRDEISTLATYNIVRKIGDGKTSIVYKATHPVHGNVAVKKYHEKYMYNFDHEVSFIKKIRDHEQFVHVYDTWEENERGFITMELMDGTLLDLIERGMSLDLIMTCVEQIIQGLAFLETNDIIHFDMKPENIGYTYHTGKYTFKLMDFGTAETLEYVNSWMFQTSIQSKRLVMTTQEYRSYEGLVLRGQHHSTKSDVWAVGAMIFEMATGHQLFNTLHPDDDCDECSDNCAAANHSLIISKIGSGLFTVREMFNGTNYTDESAIIYSIMQHCLSTNVNERYSAVELLQLIIW